MKALLLVLPAALGLAACHKSSVEPETTFPAITAAFDQEFALHHRQQAQLPTAATPEVTVQMTELGYSYCPKDVYCVAPSMAWPTLAITDAQGRIQQLQLPRNAARPNYPSWLDTASVQANGRRYLLTYSRWEVERQLASQEMPLKKDFVLWFRLSRTNP
ncbi:hypothetical protein F0P96_16670 [Hymenobacter busanensis]|uniref:Uncharacterized protein n=1 Tax=Hymenobacter busanensis TaxID=2607656 RepID=A0A7L4ZS21_9BACT|nr:hypothetical protein [Hymenobacter busanensis]KAA9327612.1 hypothetical protein F0P96_16670 [Hymenobacter busanensis]QHJ06049.1 hypothetical protein GUY19_01565 [Hymenobacter busanensis]